MIYSTSLDRGEPYEKQESIIQINIVDNVHTNISNELISNYALINTKDLSNRLLSDKLIIKFYRLDKVEDKLYNENDKVLKWLKFIKANDYEERKKVAKGDKLLMEFNNWLERYLNDEETQKIYGKWNAKIDRNTGYFFGEKDGFAKGEKENQIEVATKMLKDNMPIKDIMKYTQLTEEEINALEE